MPSDIRDAVRSVLAQSAQPWFPGLSKCITTQAWNRFARNEISTLSYGTHRWLENNPAAEFFILATLDLGASHQCRIEALPATTQLRYENYGLAFATTISISNIETIRSAFTAIASVPNLHPIIADYLRILHVLKSPAANFDVSYSDPKVPFSIFVSVPSYNSNGRMRLAESIIHECMHLQLTLIDTEIPLVGDHTALAYSPWQRTTRPLYGVLHGLYVHAVINSCFDVLSRDSSLSSNERAHIVKRQIQIAKEVQQVANIDTEKGLTNAGRRLASNVLRSFRF